MKPRCAKNDDIVTVKFAAVHHAIGEARKLKAAGRHLKLESRNHRPRINHERFNRQNNTNTSNHQGTSHNEI